MYKTLDEAEAARLDLQERIQSIEAQLAERGAQVAVGWVPDEKYKEYMEWKARAIRAKGAMNDKLRRTKKEIQRLRQQAAAERIAARGGDEQLLDGLYGLTKSLVAAGADITTDEQQLLDDVAARLNK